MSPIDKSALLSKLIARKNDLAAQSEKLTTPVQEIKLATPTASPPPPDPIKAHLPYVKGTSAERVALRKQLKEATDPAARKALKERVLASFLKQHTNAVGDKKAEIAQKTAQYAKQYKMDNPLLTYKPSGTPVAVTTTAAVKTAQSSPSLTVPAHLATPTPEELKKAEKNTKLTAQFVPGAPPGHPEAEKLIAAFNAKYEGQVIHTPEALATKVGEFKKLVAAMVPLQSEAQKQQAEKQAQLVASAKQAQAAKEKADADKIANLHNLPEEEQRLYWLGKTTSSASAYANAGKIAIEKSAKLQKSGITPVEVGFIKAFTGSYSGVNAEMRAGVMSDHVFAFKHIMNEALAKMPPHSGETVYRKINLDQSQQAKYEVGKIAHWQAFSSTSKNEGTWSGNTHFTIRNPKTGVDVQKISSHPSEAEVIMPADTYYKVLSKKTSGGVTHIEMEEVVPFGKKHKVA
jgi:ADP-ribosyltransferase exoenzyme